MYVCIYTHIHIHIPVYIDVNMYTCICILYYVDIYIYIYTCYVMKNPCGRVLSRLRYWGADLLRCRVCEASRSPSVAERKGS